MWFFFVGFRVKGLGFRVSIVAYKAYTGDAVCSFLKPWGLGLIGLGGLGFRELLTPSKNLQSLKPKASPENPRIRIAGAVVST